MRFEVPQFVDVEDRIIGPFTLKQFLYLAGGAGAGFMCYVFLPFFLFVFVGGLFMASAAALAFYRVNNRPLSLMVEAVVTYFTKDREYHWKKEEVRIKTEERKIIVDVPTISHSSLSSLARSLEIKSIHKDAGSSTHPTNHHS
jgi:hypothetical protein